MEIRLLGPVEVCDDGVPIAIGNRRQERCLFAILALETGRMVPVDRLADLLWDGEPPESARSALHTYVGRLRRALAPSGLAISTRGDGYLLDRTGHTTDVDEFTALVRAAAEATDPAARILLLDRALGLWRGPLLADVADDPLRHRLDASLNEMRMSAAEQRAEAHLGMGRHDRVIADLTPLLDEPPVSALPQPSRERLVASLMTALYRAGQPAEALARYRRTRAYLVGELGIEPGHALQELHARILRGDPGLDRPAGPIFAVRVRDQWLPWNTSGHPALEFCNTYAGWGAPPLPGSEWLRSYDTLATWAGYHDLLDEWTVNRLLRAAAADPGQAAEALAAARRLRTAIYTCLTEPDDTAAFRSVADVAEQAAKVSVFRLGDDGLGRWLPAAGATMDAPTLAVARAAADLLADPRRFALHRCPAPECGWLFLDHSGMRRFCSIATCGRSSPAAHQPTLRAARVPVRGVARTG